MLALAARIKNNQQKIIEKYKCTCRCRDYMTTSFS